MVQVFVLTFVVAQLVKKFVSITVGKFLQNARCCTQPGAR
jgi:hypothetical protein